MRESILLLLLLMTTVLVSSKCSAEWNESIVFQMNGSAKPYQIPAVGQIVTEKYDRVVAVPYVTFMPEVNELLMMVGVDYPHMAAVLRSKDFGATWSDPQFMITDTSGKPTQAMECGLTYLGNGKVVTYNGVYTTDYGRTWRNDAPFPHAYQGKPFYGWDPVFAEKDAVGKVKLMIQTGYTCAGDTPSGGAAQAYMAVSTDEGRNWADAVKVPEWDGVNEVHIIRARNGNLVAACRTEVPERFKQELDHYEGLGVSISKDNGVTWSPVKKLYDWGRHHPSMLVMPDESIVMTYVVRKGYMESSDGFPCFGIEAIVSKDNGETWDLDHKYILAAWKGNRKGPNDWWPSSQATSTVLLPDGHLLTVYGTGYRGQPNANGQPSPRDVGVVKWKPGANKLNKEKSITNAAYDSDLRNKFDAGFAISIPGEPMSERGWRDHIVRRLGGKKPQEQVPAQLQMVSEDLNMFMAVPYMIYFPDKNRLLLLFAYEYPHKAMTCYSDDLGKTWSTPKYVVSEEASSMAIGLAYLGGGNACLDMGGKTYYSSDYGETWGNPVEVPKCSNGNAWYQWDPPLVDFDQSGKPTRLMSFSTDNHETHTKYPDGHFLGFLRFSDDLGRTWRNEIEVPQMYAMNEVAFIRARNGDIVAACRTDNPDRWKNEVDHYGGLAVCISKDNGKTWSEKNWLFEWGRHHASMVLMPNGDIVMTYVVRKGYIDTPDGYPQFGIEAVVSKDNGKTWNLDHRYILHSWAGTIKGPDGWACSSQATSTWLLPDGSLVTAFGTGYRGKLPTNNFKPRDVGIIRWRLSSKPVDSDTRIRSSKFNSDLRNKFDPAFTPKAATKAKVVGGRNLAIRDLGVIVTSTKADRDPSAVLHDPYLTMSALNLQSIPGWITLKWPKEQRISRIDIYGGDPGSTDYPSGDCSPTNYTLQYLKKGHWNNILPQVKNAPDFKQWRASGGTADSFVRKHTFKPIRTNAVRLVVRKSSDTGKRVSSPDKVIIPEEKRETSIRRMDVY